MVKNCDFYSHRRKEWILNDSSLSRNYNFHFYRWGNEHSVTCPWLHIWFISEPGYESLFSLSKFSTHFTVQLQPPSVEMWNGSFFTMILFPQNWYSITNINKTFWTSQCNKYVTSTIILVLDFLSLPFCDVLKFWY